VPDSTDAIPKNGTSDAPSHDHDLEEAAEAMIFAADAPVSPEQIAEVFAEVTGRPQPSVEEVETAVRQLNEEYTDTERALEIREWGGGYRLVTRRTLSPFVQALYVDEQEVSLSRSLMETLAVVAYKQPVTRPEVDFVRGVNSDYAIRKLMEMDLVDVRGRADSLGRPLLYGTTDRFLEQFGLMDLDDLPTLREVEELLDDPSFDEERAKLLKLDVEEATEALSDADTEAEDDNSSASDDDSDT
jgi:segregation and condensation protein B